LSKPGAARLSIYQQHETAPAAAKKKPRAGETDTGLRKMMMTSYRIRALLVNCDRRRK
jgi:hypothetical protein